MSEIREKIKKIKDRVSKNKIAAKTQLTDLNLYLVCDENLNLKFVIEVSLDNFNINDLPKWNGVKFRQLQMKIDDSVADCLEMSMVSNNDNDDIFETLIWEICDSQNKIDNVYDSFDQFLNTLDSWDTFFRNKRDGLSEGAQRGLYGELFFLLNNIFPKIDSTSYALNSWRGHDRKHQDFEFNNGNIEVKTTIQKEHRKIAINSERQLDPRGLKNLFLYVLTMKAIKGDQNTLPSIVNEIEQYLDENNSGDKMKFKLFLSKAGYLDKDVPKYLDTGYFIDKEEIFNIPQNLENRFPSIIDLPSGVGNVKYSIVLAGCQPFKANLDKSIRKVL